MSLSQAECTVISQYQEHQTIRLDQAGLPGGHLEIRLPLDATHPYEVGRFYAFADGTEVAAPAALAETLPRSHTEADNTP